MPRLLINGFFDKKTPIWFKISQESAIKAFKKKEFGNHNATTLFDEKPNKDGYVDVQLDRMLIDHEIVIVVMYKGFNYRNYDLMIGERSNFLTVNLILDRQDSFWAGDFSSDEIGSDKLNKLYQESFFKMKDKIDNDIFNIRPIKIVMICIGLLSLIAGYFLDKVLAQLFGIFLFSLRTILSEFLSGKKKLNCKNFFSLNH